MTQPQDWPWYTSVQREDGTASIPLGGPYTTLEQATADLQRVKELAYKWDGKLHFYDWVSYNVPQVAVSLFGAEYK